jgi:hypothetical protein
MFSFLKPINEDTSTTTKDDDEDDDENHDPTEDEIVLCPHTGAYIRALQCAGKANKPDNILDIQRLLGGLEERQVRFADIVTPFRLAASWMRIPESIKQQLNEERFVEMKSFRDWKSVTKYLHIDGFGKCGEHVVRDAFEFMFGEYITHLEVIGKTEWIDVKLVLEFDGVIYTFLIEVKTSRMTHCNSSNVRSAFKKETDIAHDDSGQPAVYAAGAQVYDCLNLVMTRVDNYCLQRKEGAILVHLIVLDDSMQLRLCNKMTPRQMQNARAGPKNHKSWKIHEKKAKSDVQCSVCVSGGLGDMRRLLAINGPCGLLNLA